MPENARILQVGPIPPPVDGGIAAHLEGMLQLSISQQFDLRQFSGRVHVAPDAIGCGDSRLAHYRRLFHATGLDERVHFHGTGVGREKIGFLQRADIFVGSSRNESFGIANLRGAAVLGPRP